MENREHHIEFDPLATDLKNPIGNRHRHGPPFGAERLERGVGEEPIALSADANGDDTVTRAFESGIHRYG
jgi:hypothetical protein